MTHEAPGFAQNIAGYNILEDFKKTLTPKYDYFSNSTFQDVKLDVVLFDIVKLINLKRLQEFMSCVTTLAFNRSTSLPVYFIYNFFIKQTFKSIAA